MDAVVLLLGNELLAGRTRDANGAFLASRLAALGHPVRRILVLPDDEDVIVHELVRAFALAPLVVAAGGLGPTHDDLTTQAVARFANAPLVLDEAGWRELLAKYEAAAREGRRPSAEATDASRKMATVPAGALVLPNRAGHAVGYVLDVGDEGRLVVLPGVPTECAAVWEEAERHLPRAEAAAVVEVDVTLPESVFAAALEHVARGHPGVEAGSYPRAGERRVTVRFTAAAPEAAQAAARAFVAALPEGSVRPR